MTLLRLLFLLLSAFPPNVENYVGLHFFKGYTFSAVNTADDSAPKVICQRLGDIREFVRKAASYSEALLEDATSARYVHKDTFGRITAVKWKGYKHGTEQYISWKASTKTRVRTLSEKIHWNLLPCTVHEIDLSFNSLSSVSNQTLPTTSDFPFLSALNVESNQLSGNVSWSELPSTLRVLNIRKNKLSGSVEWNSLPQYLTTLDISDNKFAGSCEFHALPPGLRELNAARNNFGGELRLVRIPFTLLVLNLSNNNLSGNIDFSSLRDECHLSFHKKRDSSKTQSSVSKVTSCSLQIEEIDLSSNRLSGNVKLDVFLPSLLKMNLGNNTLGPSCEIRNIAPCTHVDMRQNWFRHVSFLDCAHQVLLAPQKV